MKLKVRSNLYYQTYGPSTFLFSIACLKSDGQAVVSESLTTYPQAEATELTVGTAQNRFKKFHLEAAGDFSVAYEATVVPGFTLIDIDEIPPGGVETLGEVELPFLFPSRYVPSDLMRGAACDLFGHLYTAYDIAMAVEEWLFQHINYQFGVSIEQSSAVDTFVGRAGVCRDFAHLGIAFCRALNVPARYVTVYAYDLEPQDFHAVFEIYAGGHWYLVDGTRKAPLNGMIRIAAGRDASDVATATLFGSITGSGFDVSVQLDDPYEEFTPVTRLPLLGQRKALRID